MKDTQKIFVVNVARCSGCYNCQLACKDEHCGNDWSPYAAPQPQSGHFWCKVNDYVHGTIPKVRIHYETNMCGHCDEPECMKACQEGAISKREGDGLVMIDPQKCTGCRKCMDACTYGSIYFNDKLNIAQKCTGCAHLLDNGSALPRCAEACPTDALSFGNRSDFAPELLAKAVRRGNVYYLNIPGKFIGGTVYDPVDEEVVIGAKCLLTGDENRVTFTDSYGDFWFNDLKVGSFDIEIAADGFEPLKFADISTEKDVNLGDIAVTRV